ncbi:MULTISPECIES: hypothetical protein [unclassified Paenibacillus]|uniref:hypothetical protein n=1 Tax=unclassified Paenibacillus TaxID=185978 RepID=UPI000898DB89|nr:MULTISPECIES: hypothetical protein [unclassified Paenibacillus]OMC68657.1 hypothetical protein BK126_12580 [Paenibacillus sp. FSL H7-0326]SDW55982.1 hypothetical protein SAMN05518848_102177 [Paenibacillus sp. PDC88]
MKKADVIKALKDLGVPAEQIEELEYNELRALLKEKEEGQDGQADTGTQEKEGGTGEAVVGQEQPEAPSNDGAVQANDDEPLVAYDYQLRLYENKIIGVHPEAKRVVITNLGAGDLYSDVDMVSFDPADRIAPGESKEFKGAVKVFVRSASRPTVRIEQFIN